MRNPFKPWLLLSGLLVIVLMIGLACGDDDDDGGDETDAPTGEASDTGDAETPTKASGEVLTDVGVSDTEIKLGQHIVQSGSLAAVYQPVAPTLQAYFKYINDEEGGVCDRQITLISEDDQYSPPIALEKAKKLAEQDEVAAFVGNLGTPPNLGSAEYINEQEIPDLFIATGVPSFADAATLPWTILFNPDYVSEGTILGNYVNDNFAGQSAAILSQNDDFGATGRDSFKEAFTGTVAAEETYDSTATDINSQLANLRAAEPDILYLYSTPAFTARAYAYMLQNQWTPQVVMSYVNSATTLAGIVGGDAGAAVGFERIAGAITNNYVLDAVADVDDPAIVEHARIMAAHGGPAVGTLTVYAQAIAEATVKTLEIACENGDLTRAGILAAAEELDFHPTVLLPGIDVVLSATDHAAIQSLVPVEVQADGTLEPLVTEPIEGGG